MEEIWKDIPDYKGIYQASNLGNIKGLERLSYNGKKLKSSIISQAKDKDGYMQVSLRKNNSSKSIKVHQLIASAFLNHKPQGRYIVVNHKDRIRNNNHIDNLEVITQRENCNKKHLKSSSKYTGVNWHKSGKRWVAEIHMNGKKKYLGLFINEYDAHLAYQKALSEL